MPKKKIELSRRIIAGRHGLGQLTLVEHALCPLDGSMLQPGQTHTSEFFYYDKNRHRRTAKVRVDAPLGLSASDELYLWGLLAITLSQKDASFDFYATPHYCLKQLGCLTQHSKGGRNYAQFRQAIDRLSAVHYQSDRFYDPIRREHRAVSFGFFSYSLPMDPKSSRAWRIVWDPLFFELCQALGGHVAFNMATYRELDCASRRLFLLLKKVFWRKAESPVFELRHLAINVLGYSASQPTYKLKAKLKRCIEQLAKHEVISITDDFQRSVELFEKRTDGTYTIRFSRGDYFLRGSKRTSKTSLLRDSTHYEPLRSIGIEDSTISRILQRFKSPAIRLWADVTLAAVERHGKTFFRRSPAAFFMDNIQVAAQGHRTAPDWYHQIQKEEEQALAKQARERSSSVENLKQRVSHSKCEQLSTSDRQTFDRVMVEMLSQFRSSGQDEQDAKRNAERFAREYVRKGRVAANVPMLAIGKMLGQ